MRHKGMWAILAGAVALVLIGIWGPTNGVEQVAHESARYHLRLYGSSIYEFHIATGNWPTQDGDLAITSVAATSRYWRSMLEDEVIVIVWPKALKPDPRDNAATILAYYNKGLISARGRSWVCWGDLRTEYIPTDDLRAYLDGLN